MEKQNKEERVELTEKERILAIALQSDDQYGFFAGYHAATLALKDKDFLYGAGFYEGVHTHNVEQIKKEAQQVKK